MPSIECGAAPTAHPKMQPRRKIQRRALDGVLLLDKDGILTSNAALQRARRMFNAAKAGHTGTLDPLATGLLAVCFGEATKFSSDLLHADKTYEATINLGVTTDTRDAAGKVLETRPVAVDRARLETALQGFRGDIEQVPPMHSALKHHGRPLYAYAREGTEIERAPRRVTIHRLELNEFAGSSVRLTIDCSKGTYIRSLAHDLGQVLGCGAYLGGLRRTRVGPLLIAHALPLETLESMGESERDRSLLPADSLVAGLPAVRLDPEQARRFGQGQAVALAVSVPPGEARVYAADLFLGIGSAREDGVLAPRRLLVRPVP